MHHPNRQKFVIALVPLLLAAQIVCGQVKTIKNPVVDVSSSSHTLSAPTTGSLTACTGTGCDISSFTCASDGSRCIGTPNSTLMTTTQGIIISSGTGIWPTVAGSSDPNTETRKPSKYMSVADMRVAAKAIDRRQLADPGYMLLANRIHLDSAPIDEARLLDTLSDLGEHIFNFDQVDTYLYNQALKQGTNVRWVWKPLRSSDQKDLATMSIWNSEIGNILTEVYGHAVPHGVLSKVGAILEKVPDAVFLVSDYAVIKPDPFLAVSTGKLLKQHKLWIIEQWDEPGFRDRVPVENVSIAMK